MKFLFFLIMAIFINPILFSSSSFTIVGMGTSPNGDLVTVRGKRAIEEADVVVVPDQEIISERGWGQSVNFKGKKTLFCPEYYRFMYGVSVEKIILAEQKSKFKRIDEARHLLAQQVENEVKEGKKVVWVQSGDPMMYGNLFLLEMIPSSILSEIIPSVGALGAASAAIKKNPPYGWDRSAVIITMNDWNGRVDLNEDLMDLQTNMVVYTMHLNFDHFFDQLNHHYNYETPVAIVFDAGDMSKQEIYQDKVGTFLNSTFYKERKIELESRSHLLMVGPFLTSGQARKDALIIKDQSCCKR